MEKPTKSTFASTSRRRSRSAAKAMGSAAVDDIVDEQHPPPGEIDLEAVEKVHPSAAFRGKAIAA
jgi:hypothetical protein